MSSMVPTNFYNGNQMKNQNKTKKYLHLWQHRSNNHNLQHYITEIKYLKEIATSTLIKQVIFQHILLTSGCLDW